VLIFLTIFRAVVNSFRIKNAYKCCTEISSDFVDYSNENKLIYTTGSSTNNLILYNIYN